MHIKIEQNLSSCKRLWNQFSPKKKIWELWPIAFSFFDAAIHTPYFLVLKEGRRNNGLLPLWWDESSRKYYFFGGEYPEDISFWFDPVHFPLMYDALPAQTFLYYLNDLAVNQIITKYPQFKEQFTEDERHYFIDLAAYSYNITSFLASFSKKHRKNLLYDLRQLEEEQYQLEWTEKDLFFEEFTTFSVSRFGSESDFSDRQFAARFKNFLTLLGKEKMLRTALVFKAGTLVGLEYAAFHNNIYYVINGGYSLQEKNLGKYLIMLHLQKAASLKAAKIDFLSGDTGWKALWNCQSAQYYMFKK